MQGFPHPLHSAELLLQLIGKVISRATSYTDQEPTDYVTTSSVSEQPSASVDNSSNDSNNTCVTDSYNLLAAAAKDVQQWALQHAYSSSWIQHFQ